MSDGRIIIDTEIDSSGIDKGVKSAKSKAASLAAEYKKTGMSASDAFKRAWSEVERDSAIQGGKTANNWNNSLGSIAKNGLKVFAGLAISASLALGSMGGYALTTGASFEAGMSKVQAISSATIDDMTLLNEKAKEMGKLTKFSALQSAEAFQYMAQAGWKTTDMLSGIEGVMNLAAASGEDLAMVSSIVTDSLTAFGLQAKDSAHFADVLAKAAAASNTNVSMLGYSFKYVAPVAGALKYSIEDVSVALGLMANSGIKGEQAGTSLRSIFTNLVSPTKEVGNAMDRLSISMSNSDGTIKPLNQLLLDLRQRFSGLTEEQKASEASSIAGKEAMSGLLAIVNASESDFTKLTDEINNSSGAAKTMAETMQNNLTGSLEQMKGSLETLGLSLYENFKGPLKNAVDIATQAINSLLDSLNTPEMQSSIQKMAEGFGNLVSSLASVLATVLPALITGLGWIFEHGEAIGAFITGIGTAFLTFKTALIVFQIIAGLGKLQVALAAAKTLTMAQMIAQHGLNLALLACPITWIIGLIVALVGGFVYLWNTSEDFRNFWIGMWEKIKTAASDAWDGIVSIFNAVIDFVKNNWKQLLLFIVNPFAGAFALLYKNCDGFRNFIDGFIETVKQTFINGIDAIVNFFTVTIPTLVTNIITWFGQLPANIGYIFGYIFGSIAKFGVDCWTWVTVDLPLIIGGIIAWFASLPGAIDKWLLQVATNILIWGLQIYTDATTWIGNTVNGIIQWFEQLPSRIGTWLLNTILSIIQWCNEMKAKTDEAASDTIDGILNWFATLPQSMLEIGTNIVKGIWDGIMGAKDWIFDKIGDFCDGVISGFMGGFDEHSPSRIMRDLVGVNLVKGIGVGIDIESPNLDKDILAYTSGLSAKMKGTVDFETAKTTASVVAQNNFSIAKENPSMDTTNMDKKGKGNLEIPVIVDGKEVARGIAPYQDILNAWGDGR